MLIVEEHSHRFGLEAVDDKSLLNEVRQLFVVPSQGISRGSAAGIKTHLRNRLSEKCWTLDCLVHPNYRLDINATKDRIGLMIQLGNVARAFYDLLKFQTMHLNSKIDAAVLAVPSSGAARALGSNIASFDRITNELALFKHIVSVPCLVLAIDE